MSDAAELSKRDTERVSMFIAASLLSDESWRPVRIRNLSANGALVDAGFDLPIGSDVKFARGKLVAQGKVIWAEGGRLGVRLSQPIYPSDWLAPAKNAEQEIADRAFALARSAQTGRQHGLAQTKPVEELPTTVGKDIDQALRLLAELGDKLGNDLTVTGQHGTVLQNIDLIAQILERHR